MSLLAVAVHDIAPEAFIRSSRIRAWLAEWGVDRATLLAIPAPLGSPCWRSPAYAAWLRERRRAGDAIAQHGFEHVQRRRTRGPRQWRATLQGGTAAEFVGMGCEQTAQALRRGRAILREAGVEPHGFVAPAYVYTPALRRELALRYVWWAELGAVQRPQGTLRSRALCLGASTSLKRLSSPPLVRGLARATGELMRIDVHPEDLDHRRSHETLEWLLDSARGRTPVTYDELAGVTEMAPRGAGALRRAA